MSVDVEDDRPTNADVEDDHPTNIQREENQRKRIRRRICIALLICICIIATAALIVLLYYVLLTTYDSHHEGNRVYYNVWSHNDFAQDEPLTRALASHVGYMEVDCFIYAANGSFYVAHDAVDIDTGKTLSSMYLDPMLQRITDSGTVWGGSYAQEISNYSVNIHIEIKNLADLGASVVYAAMDALIREKYSSIVSYYDTSINVTVDSYVNIIMQSSSIYSVMVSDTPADNKRYISYAGGAYADFIDLISVNFTYSSFEVSDLTDTDLAVMKERVIYMVSIGTAWGIITGLNDDSTVSDSEEIIITNMLKLCQFLGIRLRFWSLPFDPNFALFKQLLEIDVKYDSYIISTDYPAATVDYIETNGF